LNQTLVDSVPVQPLLQLPLCKVYNEEKRQGKDRAGYHADVQKEHLTCSMKRQLKKYGLLLTAVRSS